MSKDLRIGVEVYAIYNNKIVKGYLFSIFSPVPKIFETLGIPTSPLILNEFFKMIDSMFEIFRKINNFDIKSFVSGSIDGAVDNPYVAMGLNKIIERVFSIIDFRVLGAIIGRNLTGVDIRDTISIFVALTRVAIKSKTGETSVVNIPATSIFMTREDAENSLMGTGVKCLICSKEFDKLSDITKSLICKRCYDTISGFISFDGLMNGVSLRSVGFKTKRKLEFSIEDGETNTDFMIRVNEKIKAKYGQRISDGELAFDIDSTKISETSAVVSFKSYSVKVSSFFNKFNKKRLPIIKDVYGRYSEYLDGGFNPKQVPLASSMEHSYDNIINIRADKTVVDLNNLGEDKIKINLTTKIQSAITLRDVSNIKVELYHTNVNMSDTSLPIYNISNDELSHRYNNSEIDNNSKLFKDNYTHTFEIDMSSDSLKTSTNILLATVYYKNKTSLPSQSYFIINGSDVDNSISNATTLSGIISDISGSDILLDDCLNGSITMSEHVDVSSDYEIIPSGSSMVMNIYNEKFFHVGKLKNTGFDYGFNKCDFIISDIELKQWDLTIYGSLNVNVDIILKLLKKSTGDIITGKVKNYQFNMFKKNHKANTVMNTVFLDELLYKKNGISVSIENKKYYVDDKQHRFSSNAVADRTVEYTHMFIEFFLKNIDKTKPKKLKYETIVSISTPQISKYGIGVGLIYDVVLPSQHIPSGEYDVIVRPIYRLGFHNNNSTPTLHNVKNYMKRKDIYEWHIGSPNKLNLKFINFKDAEADTIVTIVIKKDESLANITGYGIKIDKKWEMLSDIDYDIETTDYYDKFIKSLKNIILKANIPGLTDVDLNTVTAETYVTLSYVNIKNNNVTLENRNNYIQFKDYYESGEFQRLLNNAISKKYSNLRLTDIKSEHLGFDSYITSTISVVNATKIDLEVGKEVWYTAQLGKTPVHVIFKGILATVSFGSISDIETTPWKDVELKLLTHPTEAQILMNLIPSVSATAPPFIPLVPLVPIHVDVDKVYSTYEEAKKNSLFFLCPLCFKFKKPQDDKKAKKIRDFAKLFVETQRKKSIDVIYDASMANQLSKTLGEYKKNSTEVLEDYKNIRQVNETTDSASNIDKSLFNTEYSNKYKEPEGNSIYVYDHDTKSKYDADKKERVKGSTVLDESKKKDMLIDDSLKYVNTLKVFDKDTVGNITGKAVNDVSSEIKGKLANTWVEKSKYKVMKSVNEVKSKIIDNNNSAIAMVCDSLNVDTIDMSSIMKASDLPGSVKICTECQNKLAEWFGDLIKYLRDLLIDGVYDIDFVTQVFIDVIFDENSNDFTKFDFVFPETSDQRKKLEKEIKKVLEELM